MEKIKYYFGLYKNEIIVASSCISILLIACLVFFAINRKYSADEIIEENSIISSVIEKNTKEDPEEEIPEEKTIQVDVKGFVNNPGVYELKENSRVIDAINVAGGLQENAYTRYINLSKILSDENVIIINNYEEVEALKNENVKNNEQICEITNTACVTTEKTITSNITPEESQNTSSKNEAENKKTDNSEVNTIVNINTASIEELTILDGIGESKAILIIEYREEYGPFETKEDILNVKGIGESVYEKIKDRISVN